MAKGPKRNTTLQKLILPGLLTALIFSVYLVNGGSHASVSTPQTDTPRTTVTRDTSQEQQGSGSSLFDFLQGQKEKPPATSVGEEGRQDEALTGADEPHPEQETGDTVEKRLTPETKTMFRYADVPAYNGKPFAQMNENQPYFSTDHLTTEAYELYGELDEMGRCTTCVACVGVEIMPTEKRGAIGQVKPTGWHSVKYDIVDGKYLYNRAHLIGFQLTGENANRQNLITGTRYFNLNMLEYENLIAEYVEDYDAHVLYRVTPVFDGDNLLASGVLMEGMSVEDEGDSVKFCVFMYNVQPGIGIDYATGDSWLLESRSTYRSIPETALVEMRKSNIIKVSLRRTA